MKLKVIADSSFLMIPGLFRVDIKRELERILELDYEIVVPQPVALELERISKEGAPKERATASIGLQLAKDGKVIEIGKIADEAIVELASRGNAVVATTDMALRKRLRAKGVPVIYLRQKSHLALDGEVR
ncbi:MAG: PIN domain-containing protein [Candidatus Hadarchaeota archaeon]